MGGAAARRPPAGGRTPSLDWARRSRCCACSRRLRFCSSSCFSARRARAVGPSLERPHFGQRQVRPARVRRLPDQPQCVHVTPIRRWGARWGAAGGAAAGDAWGGAVGVDGTFAATRAMNGESGACASTGADGRAALVTGWLRGLPTRARCGAAWAFPTDRSVRTRRKAAAPRPPAPPRAWRRRCRSTVTMSCSCATCSWRRAIARRAASSGSSSSARSISAASSRRCHSAIVCTNSSSALTAVSADRSVRRRRAGVPPPRR